jgi:hypothetical protein
VTDMMNLRRAILATLMTLSLSAVLTWGQDEPATPPPPPGAQAPAENQQDPPGRVARLQYLTGSVSVQPQGTGDWVEGALNRPLTNSDNIWTDKDSKAELNVGGGDLRMSSESSMTLTNIGSQNVQVQLHQGTLNLHVKHLFGGEIYEVDTPNLAFTVQKSGDYRFDVDPNGDTTVVTVRKGEGDATGGGPGMRIKSNEQVSFSNGTSLEHTVAEAPPYDGFDSWCGTRDDREDKSLSAQYVAPGVIGYEDLDANGVWTEEPTYGHVWVPRVSVGWAPYRYGHWAWVAPWGWTWVDDASWGFAPFHYGRWVYYGGAWGWAPGPVYVAPVYAPALVAWFGGPTFGVSFGFGFGGGFGWCPLGWGEPFYPWYHHGFGYFRSVNVSNTYITNVNRYYGNPPNRLEHLVNYRNPGAVTAVPSRTLQNGLAVQRTAMHMDGRQLSGTQLSHEVGLTPNRGAGTRPGVAPPSRTMSRPVVTRTSVPLNSGHTLQANAGPGAPNREFGGTQERMPVANPSGPAHYVPRPPSAGGTQGFGGNTVARANQPTFNQPQRSNPGSMNTSSMNNGPERSVPRPPENGVRTPQSGGAYSPHTEMRPAIQSNPNSGRGTSVPRPSGPVRPASQVDRGSIGSGNGGGYRGGYSAPRYSEPSTRNYGGSSGGSSPRYSSAPSYHQSAPAYHGGGGYSAPASHGGGGYSAPAYHGGGGGGGSYHGGSSSSSGGSHSGGGGHGGHR